MIIQDVRVTMPNAPQVTFVGVAKEEMNIIAPGLPVMLEFSSALGTALGAVGVGPGVVVEYMNPVAVTSQVDAESGLVPQRKESDSE